MALLAASPVQRLVHAVGWGERGEILCGWGVGVLLATNIAATRCVLQGNYQLIFLFRPFLDFSNMFRQYRKFNYITRW